jgi:hypothetical protein
LGFRSSKDQKVRPGRPAGEIDGRRIATAGPPGPSVDDAGSQEDHGRRASGEAIRSHQGGKRPMPGEDALDRGRLDPISLNGPMTSRMPVRRPECGTLTCPHPRHAGVTSGGISSRATSPRSLPTPARWTPDRGRNSTTNAWLSDSLTLFEPALPQRYNVSSLNFRKSTSHGFPGIFAPSSGRVAGSGDEIFRPPPRNRLEIQVRISSRPSACIQHNRPR